MATSEDLIGRNLGPYEVVEEIGKGGMAVVYKAKAPGGNPVAIKVLSSDFTSDERALERFQREAETCKGLAHPNIIRIHEIGETDGIHYFAMDYLPHRSLHEIIRERGRFDIPDAVRIVIRTLKALSSAHQAGVIHRDLKPENIMLKENSEPVVVDFGIAKTGKGARLTQTGVLLGTPYYMSPEQITGKEVRIQSDLYSMGVVLYELLTAEVPFQADSTFMITYKHCTEAPPNPRKLNEEISPSLELVVLKSLEKEVERRYQTADEFADDLEKVLAGEEVTFEVTRKRDIFSLPEFRQAMDLYHQRQYDPARELFEKVSDNTPDPEYAAESNRWLATTYFDEKDYVQAFRLYKYTADRWPNSEEAKRVPVYLDGCFFQHHQHAEQLLRDRGRVSALDCLDDMLMAIDEENLSEAEQQESYWIGLMHERAEQLATEIRRRRLFWNLVTVFLVAAVFSLIGLILYFRFVDPHAGLIWSGILKGARGNPQGELRDYERALKYKPENVPTLLRISDFHFRSGAPTRALPYLKKALVLDPQNQRALILGGDLQMSFQKPGAALKLYDMALKQETKDPELWVRRGLALGRLGKGEEELKSFTRALALRPNYDEALVYKGIGLWVRRKDTVGAEKSFLKAIEVAPENPEAHYQLGRLRFTLKDFDRAEGDLREASRLNPDSVDYHYQLAILYSEQKLRDKARAELESALADAKAQGRPTASIHFLLGEVFEGMAAQKQGDKAAEFNEEALVHYASALKEEPKNSQYLFRSAEFQSSLGRWDHVIELLERSAEVSPGDAEVQKRLGDAYLEADRPLKAVEAFRRATVLSPLTPEFGHSLATALISAEQYREAKAVYENLLAKHPDYVPSLIGKIELALRMGEGKLAVTSADRLGALAPEEAAAHHVIGRVYLEVGQVEGAKKKFQKALEIEPNYVPSLNQLGRLWIAEGRNQEGEALLQRSLQTSPTQLEARNLRSLLKRSEKIREKLGN